MLAAGTSHRNGQLAFALLDVKRQCILQKAFVALEQLLRFRVRHDKVHHFLIQSRLVLELRDIERIGQAAHVQHKVCFRRDAKLEAKGHHGQAHCTFCSAIFHKQVADALLVLRSGEQCRIDGIVCTLLQRLQDLAFLCKGLPRGNALRNADGMTAAGLAVAAHEHIVRGIQKQDLIQDPLLVQFMKCLLDLLAGAAAAHIHRKRHPLQLAVACFRERSDAGQQSGRNIIDAEKADILQRVHGDRFARTGKSADDQQLHN